MNIGNACTNMLCKEEKENKYYNTELHLELDEQNNSQAIIANHIQDHSVILDVGCGSGALGKLLKHKKDCTVYGIDIDEEALKMAKQDYDGIDIFSVADITSEQYKKFMTSQQKYHVIIFADLLEHIYDPGQLLYDFIQKLEPCGKILISIPNIAHWDIILGLFQNQFNYNTTGLLDTTHIRFYTYNSFLDFISNINEKYHMDLKVRLIGTTLANPTVDVNTLTNMGKFFSPQLNVFQNVFELSFDGISDEKVNLLDRQTIIDILEHENQYHYLIKDNKKKEEDINTLTKQCQGLIQQLQTTENKLHEYEEKLRKKKKKWEI